MNTSDGKTVHAPGCECDFCKAGLTQPAPSRKKPKMMLVVRTDLGMGTGKIAAQTGHAVTMAVLNNANKTGDQLEVFLEWYRGGMKKVCVGIDGEAALFQVIERSRLHKVPASLVQDAGLTQNEPGTYTCCAVGPAKDKTIEKITGSLKLLD